MSLKENVDFIKKEISAEENFMENFFKLERFYKKYKTILYGSVFAIVIGAVSYYGFNYMAQQDKIEANIAFNKLLINPNDKVALDTLKQKNPKLFQIIQYKQDNTKIVDMEFLKEFSLYSIAIKENNLDKIVAVSQNQEFLLKDFALLNKAIIEAQNGKYLDSKESLKLISKTSNISQLSQMLEHYLLTK